MKRSLNHHFIQQQALTSQALILSLFFVLATPFNVFSANNNTDRKPASRLGEHRHRHTSDSLRNDVSFAEILDSLNNARSQDSPVLITETENIPDSTIASLKPVPIDIEPTDSTETAVTKQLTLTDSTDFDRDEQIRIFNPDPTRAVWLSALCPGLGQLYNRRYWKLPIIVGGYMGLIYATNWNSRMLDDYTQGYRDLMDSDPTTKSYMDFYPPNTKEESLNKTWLEKTFKSRKDYFRRNRDLCVIAMIGVYALAMIDAYVDASLSQFDISPDVSMQVTPALIRDTHNANPSIGMHWAINF